MLNIDSQVFSAYNALPDPVWVVDQHSNILFVNESSLSVFGHLGKNMGEYFKFKVPFKGGKATMNYDGSEIQVEVSCGLLDAESSFYVLLLKPLDRMVLSRYLHEFDELHQLGKGGFGRVFKAINKLDGQAYAIKTVKFRKHVDGDVACSPSFSNCSTVHSEKRSSWNSNRRLSISSDARTICADNKVLKEVKTLASVSNHPHIVRYYNAWIEDNNSHQPEETHSTDYDSDIESKVEESDDYRTLYIQMQLYESSTMRDFLNARTSINLSMNLWIFMQLLDAVCHLHSRSVMHLDIKPDNIFMTGSQVHLGDFGLAQSMCPSAIADNESEGSSEFGSFLYSPPEAEYAKPSTKNDIFALGVILLELYYKFTTVMERSIVLTNLKSKNEVPAELAAEYPAIAGLIKSLTAADPENRPSGEQIRLNPIFMYSGILNESQTEETSVSSNFRAIQRRRSVSRPYYKNADETIFHMEQEDETNFQEDFLGSPQIKMDRPKRRSLSAPLQMDIPPLDAIPNDENYARIKQLEDDVQSLEAKLKYLHLKSRLLETELFRRDCQ